ncbi:unnamed protein product [Ilex paraguariensis]|uniref:Protein LURP-one-related 7 n=1 Tax=Ilex paraguariensis TaxID=185542 RepID=A0ABC8UZG9_9AQUA
MDATAPKCQGNLQIPVDLFVSKKYDGGNFGFADSSGNLVFRVDRQSDKSTDVPHRNHVLLDASGNSLMSIRRNHNGSWQGFKGDNSKEDLIFRVERTINTLSKTEFDVFLAAEKCEDSNSDFKMKGSPFQRSCTIYKGNSIVAQTSRMYKLGFQNIWVSRLRFRLTIFPGFVDHALIVALIVIFFDGRKFWM